MPKSSRKTSKLSNEGIAPARPYQYGDRRKEESSSGRRAGHTQGSNLIAPNTSIGQHFLKNPAVVNSIIQKAGVKVSPDWRLDTIQVSLAKPRSHKTW